MTDDTMGLTVRAVVMDGLSKIRGRTTRELFASRRNMRIRQALLTADVIRPDGSIDCEALLIESVDDTYVVITLGDSTKLMFIAQDVIDGARVVPAGELL